MSATSKRRGIGEVVGRVMEVVGALTVPGTDGVALFDRVDVFDTEQLVEAFRYLTVTEKRVAIVVPLDEEFNADLVSKQKLMVQRLLPVAVLVVDRVLGDRRKALWGENGPGQDLDPAGALGAAHLAELVLPAVTGLLLDHPNPVQCVPRRVSVMSVRDMEKDLPGRVAMAVELECRGGYLEAVMPAAPVW